jgi:serine/threonine protein kinase
MTAASVPPDVVSEICSKLSLSNPGRIGGGAFKEVFRTSSEGGPRALKVCRPGGFSARSVREVDILAHCTHQSIAQLYQAGVHTSRGAQYQYAVEEFLAGGTLTQRYSAASPITPQAGIHIATHLTSALGFLTSLRGGCVHRDIKPDNIMFRDANSDPVLVDFGLVRVISEASLTQSWLLQGPGTPYFASPEQLNNEKRLIDWRSDQFSLGVTLSITCLGVHPYQANGEPLYAADTVLRAASRGPRTSSFGDRAIAHGLGFLVRMTEPWSHRRFRAPDELSAQLQQSKGSTS